MSIYNPLMERLVASRLPVVTLSFDEIETVLGRKLPNSARDARIKRQWWANTDTHVQARAWLKAGRRAKLDMAGNQVVFVQETPPGPEPIAIADEQLSLEARLLIQTTAAKEKIDASAAAASLLNEAAARVRRMAVLAQMDAIRSRSRYSEISAVDLIREDRDVR